MTTVLCHEIDISVLHTLSPACTMTMSPVTMSAAVTCVAAPSLSTCAIAGAIELKLCKNIKGQIVLQSAARQ
jgi:hypothetical protein